MTSETETKTEPDVQSEQSDYKLDSWGNKYKTVIHEGKKYRNYKYIEDDPRLITKVVNGTTIGYYCPWHNETKKMKFQKICMKKKRK